MILFKQRKARLVDVLLSERATLEFLNSDKMIIQGPIMRRPNGTLYFHNNRYEISDYPTLKLVKRKTE
jgi:hypothetical protein